MNKCVEQSYLVTCVGFLTKDVGGWKIGCSFRVLAVLVYFSVITWM